MSVIPKKTKFRLRFRNKTNTLKIQHCKTVKQLVPIKKHANVLFEKLFTPHPPKEEARFPKKKTVRLLLRSGSSFSFGAKADPLHLKLNKENQLNKNGLPLLFSVFGVIFFLRKYSRQYQRVSKMQKFNYQKLKIPKQKKLQQQYFQKYNKNLTFDEAKTEAPEFNKESLGSVEKTYISTHSKALIKSKKLAWIPTIKALEKINSIWTFPFPNILSPELFFLRRKTAILTNKKKFTQPELFISNLALSKEEPKKLHCLYGHTPITINLNYSYKVSSGEDEKYPFVGTTTSTLLFGIYGICFTQYGTIGSKYIETIKLDIARALRKKGRIWLRICCDTPVSARPIETRMGKGKGNVDGWEAKVKPGQLFLEFSGVSKIKVEEIFEKLCKKSKIKFKLIRP